MRLARRLLETSAILVALSFVLFLLLDVMPGRPEDRLLAANPDLRAEDAARLEHVRGLDRPTTERWACWLAGQAVLERCPAPRGLVQGELGHSTVYKVPVAELLPERLLNTLRLVLPAFVLAVLLSIGLGVAAARARGRLTDRLIELGALAGVAVPAHWLGLLSVLVLAVELRLLPPSGVRDPARAPTLAGYAVHLVLPVAVLALSWTGRWTRFVRAALLEALGADYVTTARAAGVGERDVLLRHALPNALIPFVTVVAQSVPVLFSGALVVERVFAYPGMGLLVFESVSGSDHAVAVLVFLVYAALTMLSRLGADVAAGLLDPRIRTAAREAEGAS